MKVTSPTVSDTSTSIEDSRYPRPGWFRALRWLFIHWWILPIVCLAAYLLPAILLHTLFSNLLFLVQHWWAILLLLLALVGMETLLFLLYRWADADYWAEDSELRRREEEELERHHPHGFKLRHILRGHSGLVLSVAWAPDGHTLTSGSRDMTIRLWDGISGQLLHTLTGHSNSIYSVAWAPDGHILASGSSDNTIRLWDVASGQQSGSRRSYRRGLWAHFFPRWSPTRLKICGQHCQALEYSYLG